jgi:hypothetical protein
MSMITRTVLVTANNSERSEIVAVAGFLAGYRGATRASYATDRGSSPTGATRAT